MTNFILKICVQRESTIEALEVAAQVAKEINGWIDVDCRDGQVILVGPKGEVCPETPKKECVK